MKFSTWLRRTWQSYGPRRRIRIVPGDSLPGKLPSRDLVLARDDGEDWCVGFRCPCGCGALIELLVVEGARPRWDVLIQRNRPTLKPSVWRNVGCRSHFWVRDGRIIWCE